MPLTVQGQVGPQTLSDGVLGAPRMGRAGQPLCERQGPCHRPELPQVYLG